MVSKKFIDKYLKEPEKQDKIKGEKQDRKDGTGRTLGKNEPSLEDSGGFCLHEMKKNRVIVDKRTGIKKIFINDTEVMERKKKWR